MPRRRPTPRTGSAYLDAVLPPDGPGVLAMAHRGGATHPHLIGRENTLAAFEHAAALGYDYLETDVHATADAVLVAFHDTVLDRVTDRTGPVSGLAWAEVGEARVGGEPVPRLEDLLEALPDAKFNIDLKDDAAVGPLVDLVERAGAHDRVLIGSFSSARMRDFRRRSGGRVATSATPAEVVAALTLPVPLARRRLRGGPLALQVPHHRGPLPVVTASLVRRAHACGLHVHVWTVDEPPEIVELLELGVDGLITDRTDVLREVLSARGQWRKP